MKALAAPETIYGELLHQIASLYLNPFKVNEFKLHQLRASVEKLSLVDVVGALEIKGHLALLSRDEVSGCALLDRVISMAPSPGEVLVRYMQGLQQCGMFEAVAKTFFKNRSAIHGNIAVTREVKQILASQGYIQSAAELKAELAKMNAIVDEVMYSPGEHLLVHFDGESLSDSDVAPVVEFVRSYLFRAEAYATKVAVTVAPSDGLQPSAILYEFSVKATAERAADLEWDLYGLLEEEGFAAELDRRILFTVVADSMEG